MMDVQDEEDIYDSPNDAFNDDFSNMTYGRRLASNLISYKWYSNQEEEPTSPTDSNTALPSIPRLDEAWAYFEHYSLPRYLLTDKDTPKSFDRAEPGTTEPTRLYPLWATREADMAEFGIGVGLYFSTLRSFAIVTFLAGLIHSYTLYYFSNLYTDDQSQSFDSVSNSVLYKGTAICTNTNFEPCPSCTNDEWDVFPHNTDRTAETTVDGSILRFIQVNHCGVNAAFGVVSYVTLVFVIGSAYMFMIWQRRKVREFDEGQQTTTDYSIQIQNPPLDAKDPEQWKSFFESKFPETSVAVCTIVLDNEKFVRLLVQRRKLLLQLENMLPSGTKFDVNDLDAVVQMIQPIPYWKQVLTMSSTPTTLHSKIQHIDEQIATLSSSKNYNVSEVFLTFETEQMQRQVLDTMSVPLWRPSLLDKDYWFQDRVLTIVEPDEPSSIRWDDLDEPTWKRVIQQTFTFLVTLILIGGGAFLIYLAQQNSVWGGSIMILIINTISPTIVRMINSFESHRNQTSYASSQYLKVTAFRWVSTAIVTQIITPFTNNVQEDLIASVSSIFIVELIQRPVLKLVDIMGNFKRHYLGPRAVDQRRMNMNFQGVEYEIGERYTDVTKILFLTFFYCTLFPAAFFFAALTLIVLYWTDKFCILRSWKLGPQIGSGPSNFSIDYFIPLILLTYTIMSSYNYAMFPRDNACPTSEELPDEYAANEYILTLANNATQSTTIDDTTSSYKYCNQDLLRNGLFPAIPAHEPEGAQWMTPSQRDFATIYGWTSVGVLVLVSCTILIRTIGKLGYSLFFKSYKPLGKAMCDKFSNVPDILAYIPQVKVPGYAFPFLLCDIDDLDKKSFIGWYDPYMSHEHHNMIFDVPNIAKQKQRTLDMKVDEDCDTSDVDYTHLFSIVKQWKPCQSWNSEARKKIIGIKKSLFSRFQNT